jgi:hypothetical protein
MKANQILRWHIALLLLEHGESAVLESLGGLVGQAPDNLEKMLHNISNIGHGRTKRAPTTKRLASIDALLERHPEKAPLVRSLKDRYDNRTLLPELKDVRRFLERHSEPARSLKSRVEALPKIVRVLIELPIQELEAMLSAPSDQDFSGLGVISDQILGRN